MRVQGVVCADTGRNLDELLNDAAARHGFDAVGFLGGAIAESDLDEHAARFGVWPDISFGLWQPAVKWLGADVVGLERAGDGTVRDTPENRELAMMLCWDAAWLTAYVAPRYAALLKRWGTPLEAWCRWNKPSIPGSANPNRANYERGLREAERYRMAVDDAVNASAEIKQKLHDVGDHALIASEFIGVGDGQPNAERVLGTKGYYVSSPIDGWQLHGPFGAAGA